MNESLKVISLNNLSSLQQSFSSRWSSLASEFWNSKDYFSKLTVLEFIASQLNNSNNAVLHSLPVSHIMMVVDICIVSTHFPSPLNYPAVVLLSKVLSSLPCFVYSQTTFPFSKSLKEFINNHAWEVYNTTEIPEICHHLLIIFWWYIVIINNDVSESLLFSLNHLIPERKLNTFNLGTNFQILPSNIGLLKYGNVNSCSKLISLEPSFGCFFIKTDETVDLRLYVYQPQKFQPIFHEFIANNGLIVAPFFYSNNSFSTSFYLINCTIGKEINISFSFHSCELSCIAQPTIRDPVIFDNHRHLIAAIPKCLQLPKAIIRSTGIKKSWNFFFRSRDTGVQSEVDDWFDFDSIDHIPHHPTPLPTLDVSIKKDLSVFSARNKPKMPRNSKEVKAILMGNKVEL
ncbi:hypothetical protein RCL1_006132 [Eukaryota sp. TZLM3-RCL]